MAHRQTTVNRCLRRPPDARQIAADIAHEAAHLDRSIGGFLTEKRAAPGAAAARSVGK